MTFDLHGIAAAIVGAFFLLPGMVELALWRRQVPRFVQWGYPPYWPIVTFSLKIVAGAMIFYPPLQPLGLAIGSGISLAAIITIVVNRSEPEYKAIPVNLVVIALALTAFLTAP